MAWELNGDRPIYAQLAEQIERRIISGFYQPGQRLPSVRDLAADAAVNPNTMQRALAELEQKGLVHAQRTSGRYITEDGAMIDEAKNLLAMEEVRAFFLKMQSLGFDRDQTAELLRAAAAKERE